MDADHPAKGVLFARRSTIAGQGSLATLSSIANGSAYLTGFGGLSALSLIRMGGPTGVYAGVLNEGGSAFTTDAGYQTVQGTAAAIAGQGQFATAPTITGSNVASYFGFSAFSLGYSITRSDGVSTVTESLVVTQVGVAAAVFGQGPLATKSQAGSSDIAPSAVQQVWYEVLQNAVVCPVGN